MRAACTVIAAFCGLTAITMFIAENFATDPLHGQLDQAANTAAGFCVLVILIRLIFT